MLEIYKNGSDASPQEVINGEKRLETLLNAGLRHANKPGPENAAEGKRLLVGENNNGPDLKVS